MKISVSMYSLNAVVQKEKWSPADFIKYASEISLDGVELLDFYWKDKEKELEQVLKALKKYDMPVSAYDVSNNFVKGSREERAAEEAKVLEGIKTAKKLGTDIVRVFCGDLNGELTYEEGQDWIVEGLKHCAEMAEKEQIYLAIENHGLLAGKSQQVQEIINRVNSPYVKSTFDTGNFLLVHENPLDALERVKEQIVHVHFKDFRKKAPHETVRGFKSLEGEELIGVVPGDGLVELRKILDGLESVRYQGYLSLEYEGFDDAKAANEEAVRRLRSLLKQSS